MDQNYEGGGSVVVKYVGKWMGWIVCKKKPNRIFFA